MMRAADTIRGPALVLTLLLIGCGAELPDESFDATGDTTGTSPSDTGPIDGGETVSGACQRDSHCDKDDVCYKAGPGPNTCIVNCSPTQGGAVKCTKSETCKEVASGQKGCVPSGSGPDAGPDDAGSGGDSGMDDDDGGSTGPHSYFVQIKDVTRKLNVQDRDSNGVDDGEQMCSASPASEGADLFGVQLLDDSGQTKAWGSYVVGNMQGAEYNMPSAVLDGSQPSLVPSPDPNNGDQCPGSGGTTEFSSSSVVSLDCGGAAVVGFKDASGNWLPLEKNFSVVVHEYDVSCFKRDSNGDPKCDPSVDPVSCAIEYTKTNLCAKTSNPSQQESSLVSSSVDSQGNYPPCGGTELGTGSGIISKFGIP